MDFLQPGHFINHVYEVFLAMVCRHMATEIKTLQLLLACNAPFNQLLMEGVESLIIFQVCN